MTKVNCEKGPYIFQRCKNKVISFMVYAFLLAKFFSIRYMCIYQTWWECKDLRNTNTCQQATSAQATSAYRYVAYAYKNLVVLMGWSHNKIASKYCAFHCTKRIFFLVRIKCLPKNKTQRTCPVPSYGPQIQHSTPKADFQSCIILCVSTGMQFHRIYARKIK